VEPEEVESEDLPNYGIKQANILAVCNDRVYLGNSKQSDGWIMCFDEKNGKPQWKKPVADLMSFCIVGDLLFGIKESSILVAWDRYSAEEVWQAENPMGAAYHVIAADNKVIYSSTTGELRCYEWSEPYISNSK
jgi:outer membrane protein assembly factor BamB